MRIRCLLPAVVPNHGDHKSRCQRLGRDGHYTFSGVEISLICEVIEPAQVHQLIRVLISFFEMTDVPFLATHIDN